MSAQAFDFGPFTFTPGERMRLAGEASRRWSVHFGGEFIAEHVIPESASRPAIITEFDDDITSFRRDRRERHAPETLSIIDSETGRCVAQLSIVGIVELRPTLIDDSSRYWLQDSSGLYVRPVTLRELADVAAEHLAPENAWIAGMLPDDVLTRDPEKWCAPTWWELRHVVGEGSFTGVTGAQAAALVGVTPQNFRKYTARDGASTRQNMSFAMWHLLLHKLGVRRA